MPTVIESSCRNEQLVETYRLGGTIEKGDTSTPVTISYSNFATDGSTVPRGFQPESLPTGAVIPPR